MQKQVSPQAYVEVCQQKKWQMYKKRKVNGFLIDNEINNYINKFYKIYHNFDEEEYRKKMQLIALLILKYIFIKQKCSLVCNILENHTVLNAFKEYIYL